MGEKKKPTTTGWFSLKKSLQCKTEASEVQSPKSRKQLSSILTRKGPRSGCSRSIANLRDVIHGGSKAHPERPPSCSPRSIGSSEFLNPIAHEVILSNSKCELKITTGFGGLHESINGSAFVDLGTLKPGTPGPGGQTLNPTVHYFNPSFRTFSANNGGSAVIPGHKSARPRPRAPPSCNGAGVTCHKCGENFAKWEALESHHLSKHAVTELIEGDSSRKIVEIICRSSWVKSESHSVRIDRVFKVHNTQNTLARFEDHREAVKIRAGKLQKKHPRCLADGNELLRFYGTTLACAIAGTSSICVSDKCCVCRIIRQGFSGRTDLRDGVGVFTTSTSGRAFESIGDGGAGTRKALIVCRVIAGRVHRPVENLRDVAGQTAGFDSLAGKVGLHSNIEELYLLNPKALLPCFVIICKA
ncbi:uncharacterized protein LOC127265927 [Andrographis paniculata]|uniref:uncharacterized protein LOC127265927 n=1 Tax=Andrographis paniculata TaxID=175694 RepID=UPI0021E7CF1E|nr:uncharacterized protein LOC127265927 [Andrographis paniculata]XP_051151916.1 uncharacterized protein LOC127265927 [Andrographis paniculata]XP_051151917.1 uncharacterized protein LOC127265927 [Andrographis paniculata]